MRAGERGGVHSLSESETRKQVPSIIIIIIL